MSDMNQKIAATRGKTIRGRIRVGVLALMLALLAAVGGIVLSMQLTPRTFVGFLRHSGIFGGKPYTPSFIERGADRVRVEEDIAYPSAYRSSTLNVYCPSDGSEAKATVFWVHGGGYIDGDKEDIRPFAMALAQNGYAVVALNYALAPETGYPAPVVQLGEAHRFIVQNPQRFSQLPPDRLIFGGDSAGAQIASQFVALQFSDALQRGMGMASSVAPGRIKAAVLYCGPYNLKGFDNAEGGFWALFVQQIGWAYLGQKNWRDSAAASQVSTVDFITEDHPATFLTDGNVGSFEAQGRELLEALGRKGVFAQGLFYPESEIALPHEYQFDYLNYEEKAKACLEQTLTFMDAAIGQSSA